jgi:hypothetical protein
VGDPGLPTSITAGVTTGHATHSVTAHTLLNKLDTTIAATNTHALVGDGTRFYSRALLSTDVPGVVHNTQTGASYTLALADAGKHVERSNASANTVTVPPNSSVAFPVGTIINISQEGAGTTTIVEGSGVSVESRGNLVALAGQYAEATLRKRGTDDWRLSGDLA